MGNTLADTYRVEGILGEGGMGVVLEASHLRIERRFAIKVLHVKFAQKDKAKARFRREAMIGSRLGHQHIVQVLDFNETDDGAPYIVMEYLEGEDLHCLLVDRGRLPLVRAASIIRQVALALSAAHSEGVVHRDLKPENIFLCKRPDGGDLVKVLDFGISKVLSSESIVTQESTLLGTPWYMSPEQAKGLSSKIDHRTDIFALGAIFYHMLCGCRPFNGESLPSVLYNVVHSVPQPLAQRCRGLAPEVVAVVEKAMCKDREDRYGSAADMVDELARAMGEQWTEVLGMELGQEMGGAYLSEPNLKAARPPAPDGPLIDIGTAPTEFGTEGRAGLPTLPGPGLEVQTITVPPRGDEPDPAPPTPHRATRPLDEIPEDDEEEAAPPTAHPETVALTPEEEEEEETAPPTPLRKTESMDELSDEDEELPQPEPVADDEARIRTAVASVDRRPSRKPLVLGGVVVICAAVVLIWAMGGTPTRPDKPAMPPVEAKQPGKPAAPPVEAKQPNKPDAPPVEATRPDKPAAPPVEATRPDKPAVPPVEQVAPPVKTVKKPARRPVKRPRPARPAPAEGKLASCNVVALHDGSPLDADVFLDGQKVDEAPAVLTGLKPGRHVLRLVAAGYRTKKRVVVLQPGERKRVVVEMRKAD